MVLVNEKKSNIDLHTRGNLKTLSKLESYSFHAWFGSRV